MPEAYCPNPACFEGGLRAFAQEHTTDLTERSILRATMTIGARLWEERLAALAEAQEEGGTEEMENEGEEAEAEELEAKREFVWDPEAVHKTIRGIFRHGARTIRMARWLCLLSESSVAWATRDAAQEGRNLLILEDARIRDREILTGGVILPIPPGNRKSIAHRQRGLDLAAYDRLRVLTTELRRLVAEGRAVEVRLDPKVVLAKDKLEKILRWI